MISLLNHIYLKRLVVNNIIKLYTSIESVIMPARILHMGKMKCSKVFRLVQSYTETLQQR